MTFNHNEPALPIETAKARMEELAVNLCNLIASQSPQEVIGYLWCQVLLTAISRADKKNKIKDSPFSQEGIQCALEYVHATWSTAKKLPSDIPLNEDACGQIITTATELLQATMMYNIVSSSREKYGPFGPMTGEIEFTAKSTWTLIRGKRYQVLEQEFFNFVLNPHDKALNTAYGVGAEDIAFGFQQIADAMRTGQMQAAELISAEVNKVHEYAQTNNISFDKAVFNWREQNHNSATTSIEAIHDLLHGGVCNLTKKTNLPTKLLDDLSYEIGENKEFAAEGDFSRTPLRTLPARIKPLIKIEGNHYATDVAFVRDSGYRALQRGLLKRLPEYREEWNEKQKTISEGAFSEIFKEQLKNSIELTEVYYRDVDTGNWVENDTIIIVDDAIIQIEAKAGIAAMHSPATNFDSHVRAIQDLVVKAHKQCKRFFAYVSSMEEAPIYQRKNGTYEEVLKIRLRDYRLIFPIGLTIESFSPFAAMCKEIPEVSPILGKHPFISMSIDDLFVLRRFLRNAGELIHYLCVRQAVSGIKGARIFDEFDHLGAYISRNRFDIDIESQVQAGMVNWSGFCDPIDEYFCTEAWDSSPPPRQEFPREIEKILEFLNSARPNNWLLLDNALRDFDGYSRDFLSKHLRDLQASLVNFESRSLAFGRSPALFFWLHRHNITPEWNDVRRKVQAACIASSQPKMLAVIIGISPDGGCQALNVEWLDAPSPDADDFADLNERARKIKPMLLDRTRQSFNYSNAPRPKIGRNEQCWCGSGRKYKKCHGG